ncbi:MAG TPA: hemin uptake protein HemP [Acetobacteraceae bacterium]|jgi:hemin uptake protein HemP
MADEAPVHRTAIAVVDAPGLRTVSSRELMAGERVIIVRHGNDEYRLRITAAGKLILTK